MSLQILGDRKRELIYQSDLATIVNNEVSKASNSADSVNPLEVPISPASTPSSGFWVIPNVMYRGNIYTLDLKKSLLDRGKQKEQEDWSHYTQLARTNNRFSTPDFPLFYGMIKSLSNHKHKNEDKIKFLLKNKILSILSRVSYSNGNTNIIRHNFGTAQEYVESFPFTNQSTLTVNDNSLETYQAVLYTSDNANEINNNFKWLENSKVTLWKLDMQDNSERVCNISTGNESVLLCERFLSNASPSIGVRIIPEQKPKGVTSGVYIQ